MMNIERRIKMLNGIEVLNEGYVYKEFPLWILILFVVFLVVGVVFCMLGVNVKTKLIGILSLTICLICLVCGIIIANQPSDIKQYQVTISDDVSMVEFNERYDVIKVEGKIWTIAEKESE